jgi:hypothetical protein
MQDKPFETPILFIIFNRPDTEQLVFNEIRKIRPRHLFVVADGPRAEKIGEREKCEVSRNIINQVDWDCEVHKNFSDSNMGCGRRCSSGVSWFFDNVEAGIILEDDCVPDQSFFYYAEELLERYKDNEKIMFISGGNFQGGKKRSDGDYYFSRLPHMWGWATWRRVWKKYDFDIKSLPEFLKNRTIEKIFDKKDVQNFWLEKMDGVYTHRVDTWDYQLFETIWSDDGMCVSPNVNLVSNLGFGPGATHTIVGSPTVSNVPLRSISLPLTHPSEILVSKEADDFDAIEYMKNTKIKNFLKKVGLFDLVRNIYRNYL